MRKCKHCGKPVEWNSYWTTWDHTGRGRQLTAELCYPESGFLLSTHAEPSGT